MNDFIKTSHYLFISSVSQHIKTTADVRAWFLHLIVYSHLYPAPKLFAVVVQTKHDLGGIFKRLDVRRGSGPVSGMLVALCALNIRAQCTS